MAVDLRWSMWMICCSFMESGSLTVIIEHDKFKVISKISDWWVMRKLLIFYFGTVDRTYRGRYYAPHAVTNAQRWLLKLFGWKLCHWLWKMAPIGSGVVT